MAATIVNSVKRVAIVGSGNWYNFHIIFKITCNIPIDCGSQNIMVGRGILMMKL